MQFKEFFQVFRESRNFYYTVPSDKELLLYDFYALEVLDHYAPKKFNPNDLENSVAGYDEDEPELISVKEAKKTLIPYLQEELVDAMSISIACEMRHSNPSDFDRIDEHVQPVYAYYVKESHLNTLGKNFHDSSRHRAKKNTPADNHSGSPRRRSVKAFNKTIKHFGRSKVLEMAEEVFRKGSWSPSYGGPRWADISKCCRDLHNSQNIDKTATLIDHAYDLQHNTGSVFNKVQEYYKQGYEWLAKALDKKYEAVPWELIDNASSTVQRMGRKVLQKARVQRNNNPENLKKGDVVTYHASKVKDKGMLDGSSYKIVDVNELYGKASVSPNSSSYNSSQVYNDILASKLKKVEEKPEKSVDSKDSEDSDYKVGKFVKSLINNSSLVKGDTYKIVDVDTDDTGFGSGVSFAILDGNNIKQWFTSESGAVELVDSSQKEKDHEVKIPEVGDFIQRMQTSSYYTKGKKYEIISVEKTNDVYHLTVSNDLGNDSQVSIMDKNMSEHFWKLIKKNDRSEKKKDTDGEIKKGDKIKRIYDTNSYYTQGKVYEVLKTHGIVNGILHITVKDDGGTERQLGYVANRWEIVKDDSTPKIDVKVGDKVKYVGSHSDYFDKNGIYDVKRIGEGEYKGKKYPKIFTNTKIPNEDFESVYDRFQWEKVTDNSKENTEEKKPEPGKNLVPKEGMYLERIAKDSTFLQGKAYKILKIYRSDDPNDPQPDIDIESEHGVQKAWPFFPEYWKEVEGPKEEKSRVSKEKIDKGRYDIKVKIKKDTMTSFLRQHGLKADTMYDAKKANTSTGYAYAIKSLQDPKLPIHFYASEVTIVPSAEKSSRTILNNSSVNYHIPVKIKRTPGNSHTFSVNNIKKDEIYYAIRTKTNKGYPFPYNVKLSNGSVIGMYASEIEIVDDGKI